MLNFLIPILQQVIDNEGIHSVNVNNMNINQINEYFNRYAILPHEAYNIINNIIKQHPYLIYHFSQWDQKLIQMLITDKKTKQHIYNDNYWYNSSVLCHALFPRNKTISQSLGYLSKRLAPDIIKLAWPEHQAESDAMALLQLLLSLKRIFIKNGINVIHNSKNNKIIIKIEKQ